MSQDRLQQFESKFDQIHGIKQNEKLPIGGLTVRKTDKSTIEYVRQTWFLEIGCFDFVEIVKQYEINDAV